MCFLKESHINATPAQVFAFYESPGAFLKLSPPWEHVELIEGGQSLRPGSRLVLRTRVGPLTVDWVAEHTEYERGRLFADRQVRGPFRQWYHRHWFLEDPAGGTRLRDEVDYEPPLGLLGQWLGSSFLQKKLERLFDYRHEVTKRIVESGDFPGADDVPEPNSCGDD